MKPVYAIALACIFVTSAGAAEVQLNGHTFTLPDGFEIQLVGTAPVVNRPITADFDEQGRLYVTESSGTNDKIQEQLAKKPHRILRLEDSDGDGVFEKSRVFADQMMFPEGSMWHAGSLYVAAPPSIWKLTDTDGDGVAEKREEWFQGKTLTGCANDLHGPYFGLDGWVYWCKGAFAEQTHMVHGKEWKTKASHVFRCRLDGAGIEPVMTGGMDNPVDVVFLPNGDRVLSNTFIVHPGQGQRDGLLHIIYGGLYGKEQGALDGHPRTGDLMPILSHMGPAAACGLVRYESDIFGPEFQNNLFCCQFNKRMVSRHELTPQGASYVSKDTDFVVSNNTDFHPTDILEDADGSLLIVDTGGWYKLCCPSSQLHKPDILGAIYRVRKQSAKKIKDPRGLAIDWKRPELNQLASQDVNRGPLQKLINDKRPVVQRRALEQQARLQLNKPQMTQGSPGQDFTTVHFPSMAEQSRGTFVASVQKNLWAWSRVSQENGLPFVRGHLIESAHPDIRQVALHLVSLYRDPKSVPHVIKLLNTESAMNRRLAAEVLGRVGDKASVAPLLEAAKNIRRIDSQQATPSIDRALEHSIIYALIEIADPVATTQGMTSENPFVQRAALIALDQMPGGSVSADRALLLLESAEPLLQETANWLVSRHPEWGGALAGWFAKQLQQVSETNSGEELRPLLVRHAGHPTVRDLLAASVLQDSLTIAARKLALNGMAQAKPSELPPAWADSLAQLTAGTDLALAEAAVQTAREMPAGKKPNERLNEALIAFAAKPNLTAFARLNAMAAVHGGMPNLSAEQFALIIASLPADQPIEIRSAAADGLAKAKLTPDQLKQIAELVKTISPLELDRLLEPFERSTDEASGLLLLDSLKKASALSSLRIDSLQQKLAKYSPAVQQAIPEVIALVNVDAAAQKKQLEAKLAAITGGDVRRGQAVFNSTKAACTACHKFGYLGGTAGPDMTRIGGIRTERDLLESILFPSLSFVRSYEPVIVVTTDGRIVNGLIRNESSTELLVTTGPNQEVRVPRADIEEVRPSTVSVMPAGLDKQLTDQELADLVAFLKNAK
jgi:putative membrane-bound dehydrogenase-like protein